jgi:DNA-binding MarR family transcriptional regulator
MKKNVGSEENHKGEHRVPPKTDACNVVHINRGMLAKRKYYSYEECLELGMTPAQKEVFLVIDEWWKEYGYGPSIRDICRLRGKTGLGNTVAIIDRLIRAGVLKRVRNSDRSVRPVYINFRKID